MYVYRIWLCVSAREGIWLLCFMMPWRHRYQPESKTVADNASVNVVEVVIADCSPISRVIDFQTSLAACPSHQPDIAIWTSACSRILYSEKFSFSLTSYTKYIIDGRALAKLFSGLPQIFIATERSRVLHETLKEGQHPLTGQRAPPISGGT